MEGIYLIVKYRVHEVAKDFGRPTKEIADILTKYATAPKNHMQVLEDRELSILFDYLTQQDVYKRQDYETTLTALSPCSAAFFPQEQVAELLRDTPGAAANYIRYLSGRIHFLSRKIEGLTAPGAAGKLARCLLAEGGVLSCTATELARRLDVSRASLYLSLIHI